MEIWPPMAVHVKSQGETARRGGCKTVGWAVLPSVGRLSKIEVFRLLQNKT